MVFPPFVLCMRPSTEANDAMPRVRGRSATPRNREDRVPYKLLFVVGPQGAGCERKEPTSTCSFPVDCSTTQISLYAVVPQPHNLIFHHVLSHHAYNIGYTGYIARPESHDKNASHRHNCLCLLACCLPYPHELVEKDRILPDGSPGVLDKNRSNESRSHAG